MIVELISSTRVVQKLTYYSTKDTYIRTNINGAWSTWNRVLHSGNYSDYANKTTVSNSLTDISTTNALSANQGKVLKGLVDGHDHDSTYIKKTGGVSQHSNGNIIIPSASDTTDNDATGKIPFAGHLVSTTYSIEEFATKLKSFIGAIRDKDNRWWNVISARQTNGGGSDGEKQGLLLKTGLEATGDLIWNKQSTGNWGTERTILDSSNYSNYANKTTVDTALSSSSTNPVQNKVINTALGGKAATSHTHGNIANNGNVELITSTQTTSTNAWTGTSSTIASISKGTRIYYMLTKAPTTSGVTLNLTLSNGSTTGAKQVIYNGVQLTNQIAHWNIIEMMYDGSNWFVINPSRVSGDVACTVTYTDGSTSTINLVTR